MNDDFDSQLISKIKDTLKDSSGNSLLIPRCPDWSGGCSEPMDLTIRNLWDRSQSERVIVLYKTDSSILDAHPELWPQSKIISNWPDTTSIGTLNKNLMSDAWNDQKIRDLQKKGGFYVLQSIRTADKTTIINGLTTILWEPFIGHKTLSKYAQKIWDHFGWCNNCPRRLLQFGDETNQGVNRSNLPEKIFGQRANIIIVDNFADRSFQWEFQEDNYDYVSAVIQMNISRYCNKWMGLFSTSDDWFGGENHGGGMAVGDINGKGGPDLVVFHIDHPSGGNHGYYRIGWDIGQDGTIASWTDSSEIPDWFGGENQGGGIAVGDINGKGGPDLVVFHIDHPSGGNRGYYRIGWDIGVDGVVTNWTDPPIKIPDWFGGQNQGGGIALGDINGNGILDLTAFNVDHPSGGNHGWYRIGLDMNSDGTISGSRCPSPF